MWNWLEQQWQMIKSAVNAWLDVYAPSMGAALSYYTLFSLAPLLIIVIAVAGRVYYSAQTFLLGAEYTWVYANRHGSRRAKSSQEGNAPRRRSKS